ncbi:hypothetical protein CVT24_013175 [Panaeolus cyanescens]|uniref:Glutamine amidotransferase domain-containing protein n=1 Tax=Panaeolus cyanescens TaxID=181874 RepID=A0A409VVY2_9AGAR|nr:hypothetical protein CVT24_013175 [Panaeolus cyanescens]
MSFNFLQPIRALVASLSFSSLPPNATPQAVEPERNLKMVVRIGILSCYHTSGIVKEKFGEFEDVYKSFLRQTAPDGIREVVDETKGDGDYVFEAFDATASDSLPHERLDEFDCFMITGSPASANDEMEWVIRLAEFIAQVAESRPQIRFLGICFGHQIIARAMGGKVEYNGGTWEAGPTDMKLTEVGKRVFGEDTDREWTLQQLHRDHVVQTPPNFEVLGSSPITPIQGMVRFRRGRERSGIRSEAEDEIQFLTTQGHPEFSEDLTMTVVDAFVVDGMMDAETAAAAKARRGHHVDSDGVGKAMWNVILQASRSRKS